MPMVGLGVWKCSGDIAKQAVFEAIKIGYRHLDCACDYGNERQVGEAIGEAISQGICRREDLWVTSKLWNTYHHREHVPLACQRTLDDLGLDYLDLYLIHFPISLPFVPFEERYPPEWTGNSGTMSIDPVPYRETWEAMETLVEAGKVKHIGVSNLTCIALMDVLSYCKIKPAVNQVELHPYLPQEALVQFAKDQGIGITAFSPLGALSYIGMGMADASENVLEDPVVIHIAKAHGQSPAQVCLRFQVQRGIAVIPKSQNPERLKENISIFDFVLSEEEMQILHGLDRKRRFNDPGVFTKGMGMQHGWPIYG